MTRLSFEYQLSDSDCAAIDAAQAAMDVANQPSTVLSYQYPDMGHEEDVDCVSLEDAVRRADQCIEDGGSASISTADVEAFRALHKGYLVEIYVDYSDDIPY